MVIKVLNLDKCLKKFQDMAGIDPYPVIRDGTAKVLRSAKANSPVSPTLRNAKGQIYHEGGTLREGNKMNIVRNIGKNGSPNAIGIVYNNVEYAIYQEFGTVKMKAQPFLIPALNEHRQSIINDMKQLMKTETTKISKG
jgi:HK97 gp10 family phage protein